MKQPDETQARRRRRPGSQEASHAVVDRTRAYRHLHNPFVPMRVFSDDQVAAIHEAALGILETQGMKVLSEDARMRYAQGGAQVDEASQIVRLDRGLIAQTLASAPHDITLHAVDPERHMPLAPGCVVFCPTSGPPNIMDTARGRRAGAADPHVDTTVTERRAQVGPGTDYLAEAIVSSTAVGRPLLAI